jgi:hypothetical protein
MKAPVRSVIGDRTFWISVAIAIVLLGSLFVACSVAGYGCGPTPAWPATNAADLRALRVVLASDPRARGIRAIAVHGHEAVVVDENCRGYCDKYSEVGGISDTLRDDWSTIFQKRHPREFHGDTTIVTVLDSRRRYETGISMPQCAMP